MPEGEVIKLQDKGENCFLQKKTKKCLLEVSNFPF